MAEAQQFTFKYQELVELMLDKQGITEGLWALYVKFGLAAANVGSGPEALQPAAIIPVLEIGIRRSDEETSLVVDAGKRGSSQQRADSGIRAASPEKKVAVKRRRSR